MFPYNRGKYTCGHLTLLLAVYVCTCIIRKGIKEEGSFFESSSNTCIHTYSKNNHAMNV